MTILKTATIFLSKTLRYRNLSSVKAGKSDSGSDCILIDKSKLCVVDCSDYNHFSMTLNGRCAVIEYKRCDNVFELVSTKVPHEYRGLGIAQDLAKKTFDYIVANDKRMKLSCDLLKKFYKQNKQKYENYVIE